MRRFTGVYGLFFEPGRAVPERGIAQSKTKMEQGIHILGQVIHILGTWFMVVIHRYLSGRFGYSDGKLSRRIHIAEQDICNGSACFLSHVPSFDDGRYFFCQAVD